MGREVALHYEENVKTIQIAVIDKKIYGAPSINQIPFQALQQTVLKYYNSQNTICNYRFKEF